MITWEPLAGGDTQTPLNNNSDNTDARSEKTVCIARPRCQLGGHTLVEKVYKRAVHALCSPAKFTYRTMLLETRTLARQANRRQATQTFRCEGTILDCTLIVRAFLKQHRTG